MAKLVLEVVYLKDLDCATEYFIRGVFCNSIHRIFSK